MSGKQQKEDHSKYAYGAMSNIVTQQGEWRKEGPS